MKAHCLVTLLANAAPTHGGHAPAAGRLVLRTAMMHPGVEIVAVNDPFVDAGDHNA
jgi:glyceraldehyde-3-phosphate dehydrogenase/erythrose-4-phosphate dehydrogenase